MECTKCELHCGGKKYQSNCPKGVPKSYAETGIPRLLNRMNGVGSKNYTDVVKFKQKFEKFMSYPEGKTWNVDKVREEGSHGQEEREASYMMVCFGRAVVEWIERNDGKKHYPIFTRNDSEECKNKNGDFRYTKKCKKCGKIFPFVTKNCNTCTIKKRKEGVKPLPLISNKKYSCEAIKKKLFTAFQEAENWV